MLGRHFLLNRCNASRQTPTAFLRQHTTLKNKHNQQILELLSKHKEVEETRLDPNFYKIQAFTNAIYAIAEFDQPIRSGNDMLKLQGVGPGIISRVNEYLLSDATLSSSDPALYQEIQKAYYIKQLSEIPGIGPTTAKKLVQAGCRSLKDLQSGRYSSLLSVKKLAKIKYAGHLEPVQRQDAEDVLHFCSDSLDPQYECTLVGDYRRGIITFPEMHLMLSHPDFVHVPLPNLQSPDTLSTQSVISEKRPRGRRKLDDKTNLLHTDVIPLLQQRGLIAETFSMNYKSWEGIVRLPGQQSEWNSRAERISAITHVKGLYRKMTIHFVPLKSRGSSLICLTGDSDFEKDICYRARKRNMLFNEYGIWKWMTTPPESIPDAESNGLQVQDQGYWSLMKSSTEDDVFKELGMEPIDPTRRNFSYISSKTRKKRTSPPFKPLFK